MFQCHEVNAPGCKICFNVMSTNYVGDLLNIIEDNSGFSIYDHYLTYFGKGLNSKKKLAYYDMSKVMEIELHPSMCGGAPEMYECYICLNYFSILLLCLYIESRD